jgi:hypothetical protein
MPAEFTVADDLRLLQINHWRFPLIPHRRQVTSGRMATTVIVPIRRAAKDVVEVSFADHAKAVEHFIALSKNVATSKHETTVNPESNAVDANYMTPLRKAIDDSQAEGGS